MQSCIALLKANKISDTLVLSSEFILCKTSLKQTISHAWMEREMMVESHYPCLRQEFIYEAYKPPQLYLSLNEPILDRWLSSLISTHRRKEGHQLFGLLMLLSAGSPCLTFLILTLTCNLLSCQLILLFSALHSRTMEKSIDILRKEHSLKQQKNRLCFSSGLSSQA